MSPSYPPTQTPSITMKTIIWDPTVAGGIAPVAMHGTITMLHHQGTSGRRRKGSKTSFKQDNIS
jgi:hypothetical protein